MGADYITKSATREASAPRTSPTRARYASAARSPRGIAGLAILGALCAGALLAPVLFPAGYDVQGSEALVSPSLAHPFGLDEFGRDILARSLFGLRVDLGLILLAVPLGQAVGLGLGLVGAISQRLGNAVQRMLDVILGFPTLLLGICLIAVWGPGWMTLFLTIFLAGIPTAGRLAHATWLSVRSQEYVVAARLFEVPTTRIVWRHVVPVALDAIVVNTAIWMVAGIYIEAGLSIVGLGVQPPQPSLGVLLNNGLRFVAQSPTYVIGPATLLAALALAFSLLADALNESVGRR